MRPCKLKQEIQDKIVNLIKAGNYIEVASASAGISKDTLYAWLKRGAREEKGKFKAFSDAVEKAQADAESRDVMLIAKAAETQWQAAAWRLERKFPHKWGRMEKIEHSGNIGAEIDDCKIDDRIKELLKRREQDDK